MDWRVLAAPTQLAAHCFACFTPQIYEQKRDDSQSGFVKMLKVFFWGGGGGEGSPSSFLSMIIQKQRASKTAFYASYNLTANLQRQTGNSFFLPQVVNLHCILGYWP